MPFVRLDCLINTSCFFFLLTLPLVHIPADLNHIHCCYFCLLSSTLWWILAEGHRGVLRLLWLSPKAYGKVGTLQNRTISPNAITPREIRLTNKTEMRAFLSYCKYMMAKQMEVQTLSTFKTRSRSVSRNHKTSTDALEPHLTHDRSIYNKQHCCFNLLYCLIVALNIMFKMQL